MPRDLSLVGGCFGPAGRGRGAAARCVGRAVHPEGHAV